MITDEEVDALRSIADRIRGWAQQCCYGFFHGGDPRSFSPDPECADAEELARHAEDCAAWEAGDHVDRGPNHVPLDSELKHVSAVRLADGGGWKTVSHYGLGVNTYEDPELMKLAQDLDDVIDRIRQVVP